MGLMDVLNGMANGPRGPAEPGKRGGISPITMGLLALLAYKTMRGEGRWAASFAKAARPQTARPQTTRPQATHRRRRRRPGQAAACSIGCKTAWAERSPAAQPVGRGR